jgi:hypothetical protein
MNLKRVLVLTWLLILPFSHAPGFIHPLLTPSGILSTIIIFFYAPVGVLSFCGTHFKKKYQVGTIFSIALFIYVLVTLVSLFVTKEIHTKFFNYVIAYLWMFLLLIAVSYVANDKNINADLIVRFITVGLVATAAFSTVEFVVHFFFVDIGSLLPRPDRFSYFYNHPIIGYRVRAFNYESANLAFYANMAFLSILSIKGHRGNVSSLLLLSWLLTLFFSWSSLSIILALPIVFMVLFSRVRWHYLLLVSSLLLGVVVEFGGKIFGGVEVIYFKALGYVGLTDVMESANIRSALLDVGLSAFNEHAIVGLGPAGFYFVSDSGLNNLYLMMAVQYGFIGFILLPVALFSCFVLALFNRYFICAYQVFVCAIFLWFVGDFWIPQIYLPIFILSFLLSRKNSVEVAVEENISNRSHV